MPRGRKPFNCNSVNTWEDIFWKNIPTYINILNNYFSLNGFELIEVGKTIEKNIFKIPKGLNSKEIKQSGVYPVISQSKEFIIGYSDNAELLVKDNFPLIVFGDHSKTIKYVEKPFVIGADGVKILKPKNDYNEKFFYYFLHGVITDTKDYGRHYSLLRKGSIANVKDIVLQKSIVSFLDNLKDNSISENHIFFNQDIENDIFSLQISQLKQLDIASELNFQLDLIKQLRQAFLREAMQGKLCQAKPSEAQDTGKQLLSKIKAEKKSFLKEKNKKEKALNPIAKNEIPYKIPEHWAWCKLGELFEIVRGSSPRPKGDPRYFSKERTEYHWITIADFANYSKSNTLLDTRQFLTEAGSKQSREVTPQDLLIAASGVGSVGKSSQVGIKGYIYDGIMAIKNIPNQTMNKYLSYYLKVKELAIYDIASGANWLNINTDLLNNYLLPLPPLHEQEQIVAKLEEFMAFCDGLEQSIKESQAYNEMLLQQVLREALQGETVE